MVSPPLRPPKGSYVLHIYIYTYIYLVLYCLLIATHFFIEGGTTRRPSWRAAKVIRIGSRQRWRPRSAQVLGEGHFSHAKSSEVTTYMMFF